MKLGRRTILLRSALLVCTIALLLAPVVAHGHVAGGDHYRASVAKKSCHGKKVRLKCETARWFKFLAGSRLHRIFGGGGPTDPTYTQRFDLCRDGSYVWQTVVTQPGFLTYTDTETGDWRVRQPFKTITNVNFRVGGFTSIRSDGTAGPDSAPFTFYALSFSKAAGGQVEINGTLWSREVAPC